MKQIIEYIRSYSKALLRKIGVQVAEHPRSETVWRSGSLIEAERRRETRVPMISPCTYGLMRAVDRDGVILEEGHGTAVNDSSTGMRLLLGIAPSKGQLLEIHTGDSTLGYAISLVEVCWTKPLRKDEEGALYLVGCRQNFGTMCSAAI
ncbi:MAG: PilZ domain-containing protein [Nitrospirae bacterium]|nr:PilZ domain-containing protein [Nitrospirota bacterium]